MRNEISVHVASGFDDISFFFLLGLEGRDHFNCSSFYISIFLFPIGCFLEIVLRSTHQYSRLIQVERYSVWENYALKY